MERNQGAKAAVLERVALGKYCQSVERSKYSIHGCLVHVRYCSANGLLPNMFKFNINPNTLASDYEVWICGDGQTYYLIPIEVLRRIYDDPSGYIDRHHQGIRIVSVNVATNTVTYARGGKSQDITPYFRKTL